MTTLRAGARNSKRAKALASYLSSLLTSLSLFVGMCTQPVLSHEHEQNGVSAQEHISHEYEVTNFRVEGMEKDLKTIEEMGYFVAGSVSVIQDISDSSVTLEIRVQENPPVTEFCFKGNTVFSNDELTSSFTEQLGKPQNISQIAQSIDTVEQAYHESGYSLARVTDVKSDPDGSVHLQLDEGVLRSVQVSGQDKSKVIIIRDAIKAKAGTAYNERLLRDGLRKLTAIGHFQDIRRSLYPSPSDPDNCDLRVEVYRKRTIPAFIGSCNDTVLFVRDSAETVHNENRAIACCSFSTGEFGERPYVVARLGVRNYLSLCASGNALSYAARIRATALAGGPARFLPDGAKPIGSFYHRQILGQTKNPGITRAWSLLKLKDTTNELNKWSGAFHCSDIHL